MTEPWPVELNVTYLADSPSAEPGFEYLLFITAQPLRNNIKVLAKKA